MPGKRARRLAEQMADAHLSRVGITKAAGGVQRGQLVDMYLPYATADIAAVVMVEKALKRTVRQMEAHAAEVGRLIDENGVRINRLAESYAASMVPGTVEVERGYRDLDLQRFRVGLIDQQAQAPKKTNGHQSHGEGVSPSPAPQWHPENDGGL